MEKCLIEELVEEKEKNIEEDEEEKEGEEGGEEKNGNIGEQGQLASSTSNLMEVLHGGRPKDEEPHVNKKIKKKRERTEYIVRVDLVRNFFILKGLYALFPVHTLVKDMKHKV
ncbi:uncharacterized protein LOC111712021 [Eurytemora carolleeae]|uniref:uncharacterized protein LOC111712021 n=1 Tax=Eurytemora carolleeae TaxID=1294199 RepID=UPI000C78E63E|nr:uncharacterized protein LOC111712021 [Eurytemora carolleeae]|eukprot:XP_023342296.1 uncharacterized protein LOC111712021 [Eurytemora affinis]